MDAGTAKYMTVINISYFPVLNLSTIDQKACRWPFVQKQNLAKYCSIIFPSEYDFLAMACCCMLMYLKISNQIHSNASSFGLGLKQISKFVQIPLLSN